MNLGMAKRVCCSVWRLCRNVSSPCRDCIARPILLNPARPKLLLSSERNVSVTPTTRGHNFSDSNNTPDTVKGSRRKNRQFTAQKLHHRVLTEEEKAEDASLKSRFSGQSLPEEDVFGTLRHRENNHREHTDTDRKVRLQPGGGDKTELELNSHFDNISSNAGSRTVQRENYDVSLSDVEWGRKTSPNRTVYKWYRKDRSADKYADTFGTLQEDDFEDRIRESQTTEVGSHEERFSEDDDEDPYDRSHIRLSNYNRRHIPEWYGRKIIKLNKKGKIKEAIEVLEEWMLKKDRVMPNTYVFTSLISGLGHAGYTKKAFQLFNRMKKMGIRPKPQTYTALFNACANSPWQNDGLKRADNLYRLMQEQGIQPTFITCKAMIKAFAMCGDVRRAFALMDELSQVHRPDAEAFSFLLMACVSDEEAGLRHAIQVWRLMQKMNIQPDLPLYNLFIRCVRDCGVGEATTLTDLLGDTASAPSTPELTSGKRNTANDIALLESRDSSRCSLQSAGEISSSSQSLGDAENYHEDMDEFQHHLEQKSKADIDSDVLQIDQNSDMSLEHLAQSVSTAPTIPDLLSPNCDVSGVVSLGDLSSKESQLALVGGVEGILGRMVEHDVKPDIITFSQLITVAVPTVEAEERVLEFMKKMKVKPDIDLLNALIHKRCMRWDFEAARDVQQMISEYKLTPNQRTFGVLAMTCRSQPDAALLLHDMEACELQPNKEILGTLIYAARTNFKYMLWVVREAEKLDLAPNTKFLQNIEKALAYTRKMIVLAERKGEIDSYFLSPHFQQSYESFKEYYDKWLQRIGVDVPPHPWATFRPKQDDDEKQQAAKTV